MDRLPVLKADAIKYLMTFRNQLPREAIVGSLAPLVALLRSASPVVHSYAANALDKILILRAPSESGGGALIRAQDLKGSRFHSSFVLVLLEARLSIFTGTRIVR